MNTLLHALKSPQIYRCIIGCLDHAQQGVPETFTFRGVIKSRVWLIERLHSGRA
jgi:hypothetical protein